MNKPPHRSLGWVIFLTLTILVSVGFLRLPCELCETLPRITCRIKTGAGGAFIGILALGTVIAHAAIYGAMRVIHKLFGIAGEWSTTDLWPPAILGFIENPLYVVALVVDKPEFIAFWIVLKTAGGWSAWSGEAAFKARETERPVEERNRARRRFHAFLYGNALSIVAALASYAAPRLWVLKSC